MRFIPESISIASEQEVAAVSFIGLATEVEPSSDEEDLAESFLNKAPSAIYANISIGIITLEKKQ